MNGTTLRGVEYAFPQASRTVRELASEGLLKSDSAVLEGFGFERVHIAVDESPFDLALEAAARLLAAQDVDPEEVGLLVYSGSPGVAAFASGATGPTTDFLRTTERFRFPATRLQFELGLSGASVLALDQLACTGLFGALRVASGLCMAERIDLALCISAEFFPADAGREAIFNCTSDAACALLVQRGGDRNRLLSATQVTKGYYWDAEAVHNEIVASYFPTARHVIQRTLDRAGWSAGDVDWVIPHNVGLRSWEVLLALTGLSGARLWSRNIARDGHTLAGDNFINLRDVLTTGSVRPGDRMLLFSYGYGAHWTALALEV